MAHKKLIRFEEIKTFPNVLVYPQQMQGNWKKHFGNDNPVILELACGKGEYTIGLAKINPGKNIIGVDIKGNRIWKGAKAALEEKLRNVAFLRTQIEQINNYFSTAEVSEIWITFPDPFLRKSKAKKRLVHQNFLTLYHLILQPGGIIHLKTDSQELYAFALEALQDAGCTVLQNITDLYSEPAVSHELAIKTYYENKHLAEGRKIFYLQFVLPENMQMQNVKKPAEDKRFLEDIDFYYNEDGLMVLTKKFLLQRGYCCGKGCLHCPYQQQKVKVAVNK